MSFAEEYDRDLQKYPKAFWLHFVHIFPRADQQDLIEELSQLCSEIRPAADGYSVETDYLSHAAGDYLLAHQIPFTKVVAPKDPD